MKHISRLGSLAPQCHLLMCRLLMCGLTLCILLFGWPCRAAEGSANLSVALPSLMLFSQQGYLGVDLGGVDSDHAAALHLKDTHAAEVTMIDHDAPAAKSGLRVHDVILQLDGRPFLTVEQLRHRLLQMPAGRTITLLVSRDGNHLTYIVTLCDQAKLQQQAWSQHVSVPAPAPAAKVPAAGQSFLSRAPSAGPAFLANVIPKSLYIGADVNPVRTQLADYFGVTSGTGLLVENVDSQSPAARAGMKAGDVIVKVDAQPMKRRSDWVKAMRRRRGQQAQVTVMRNKQEQILILSAGKPRKG